MTHALVTGPDTTVFGYDVSPGATFGPDVDADEVLVFSHESPRIQVEEDRRSIFLTNLGTVGTPVLVTPTPDASQGGTQELLQAGETLQIPAGHTVRFGDKFFIGLSPGRLKPKFLVSPHAILRMEEIKPCTVDKASWSSNDSLLAMARNGRLGERHARRIAHARWVPLLRELAANPSSGGELLEFLSYYFPDVVSQNPAVQRMAAENQLQGFNPHLYG